MALLLTGCAGSLHPSNKPLVETSDSSGYRLTHAREGNLGETFVILAFSGGGTRAAALSYGVLRELKDTIIDVHGKPTRLLDEVDAINSVSGGSFTAAYYGLFGERLFKDYKRVFLHKSIQGILIQKFFEPSYWWKSLSSGFDRTEMAIEYFDEFIFEGKRFRDLDLAHGPFIEINATDLGGGNRFSFVQVYFDLICSDLADFKVARAVTASAAVPLVFPTVVLKNHAGECDLRNTGFLSHLMAENNKNPRISEIQRRIKRYLDREHHPYIHLLDGGLSDNLAIRSIVERLETFSTGFAPLMELKFPKHVLVISVDAEVHPPHSIDESPENPSLAETATSFPKTQMVLYNQETRILLEQTMSAFKDYLASRGTEATIDIASVSFSSVHGQSLKDHLNSLPTSLELSESDVDMLDQVGGQLLRQDPQFKRYLSRVNGRNANSKPLQEPSPAPSNPP